MQRPVNTDAQSVSIGGYDPVSYFQGEAVQGSSEHQATHNGAIYHFANANNLERFAANPDIFIPQYGGFCATAMSEGKIFEVDPTNFKIVDDRLFLFYRGEHGDTLPEWNADEANRLASADRHWSEETFEQHE